MSDNPPQPPSTIDSEVEDIFLGYDLDYVTAENKFKRGHIDVRGWDIRREEALAKAAQAVTNLIAQEANKAVVAELERLKLDTLMPEKVGGRFIHEPVTEFAKQLTEWIDERIQALTADKEQNLV